MCNCINVEIGSYSNQEIVERPSFLKGVKNNFPCSKIPRTVKNNERNLKENQEKNRFIK